MLGAVLCSAPMYDAAADDLIADGRVRLGKRYIDALRGFSLRPPANTQRRRINSPTKLVSWSHRDPGTGAIDLTLTVLLRSEKRKSLDLDVYAKDLAKELKHKQRFQVDSATTTKVAGKNAIDLRGKSVDLVGLWQRQTWVWDERGRFLIFVFSGPSNTIDRINTVCRSVLDTVRLIDPTTSMAAHEENLKRGERLLAGLTDKKLSAVFKKQDRWYLLRVKGKDVGYMVIRTSPKRREGADGYEVRSLVKIQLPKDDVRQVRRMQFSTANRSVARWREKMTVGQGPRAVTSIEDGIRQGNMILCHLRQGIEDRPRNKSISSHVASIYLPRAFGMMLPKLVSLESKVAYAFGAYNSQVNDFDMRTFTVKGEEKIVVASREMQALRVEDQPAADAEPARLWVDARGELLRMETDEGLIMEKSTRGAVVRRFPADEARIRAVP